MSGKIFINYRRGDDPGYTGRLSRSTPGSFQPRTTFLDVDNIAPGLDFVRVLTERVAECDVMLTVIGKGWTDARDENGSRRLDDPNDFVRVEIVSALGKGKRVIPVLVGEARMPHPNELPEVLRPLANRNAVRLTHERFRADVQGLIKAVQLALEEPRPTTPPFHVKKDGERSQAGELLQRGGVSLPIVLTGGVVFAGILAVALAYLIIGKSLKPAPVPTAQLTSQAAQPSVAPNSSTWPRGSDQANIMTAESSSDIAAKSKGLEDKSGIRLVVATVTSLQGDDVEAYANKLFNALKLGQAQKNNGVLLLVASNEHKVRIEVGRGLEGTLTNALCSDIISSAIIPRFKSGDFSGGIDRGVDRIIRVLSSEAAAAK